MSVINEFKEFISKGNVIDLAVGVIIGAAFGKIITSLVEDIVMPPLGILIGGVDFSDQGWVLIEATQTSAAVSIQYGAFLNTIIQFLIIASVIFFIIKQINLMKRMQSAQSESKATPEDIKLLTEIRDLLKQS